MRTAARLMAALTIGAAVATACLLPATRFETRLELLGIELPVVVLDRTGLIASVAPEAAGPGVGNLDGQPDVLIVGWSGGACDTGTTFEFTSADTGFVLEQVTETLPGVCPAVELSWGIGFYLVSPLDASRVTFVAGP
jgi:hypothetical protein